MAFDCSLSESARRHMFADRCAPRGCSTVFAMLHAALCGRRRSAADDDELPLVIFVEASPLSTRAGTTLSSVSEFSDEASSDEDADDEKSLSSPWILIHESDQGAGGTVVARAHSESAAQGA